MPRDFRNISAGTLLRKALIILVALVSTLNSMVVRSAAAQGGGLDSTITLQMPFLAGESWTVGGAGYFYGFGGHTNANNNYYATDWNRTNDFGAAVLPVADGTVTAIQDRPCINGGDWGCYVEIAHANGYQTRYAHLDDVLIPAGTSFVHTWDLIGLVGGTGQVDGVHLHLNFKHFDAGGYYSRCWNNGQPCPPNNEQPQQPQGHRPSPMMTASGPTTLVNGGTYTSVNGRVYLADLRNNYAADGRISTLYVRNNGTVGRNVTIKYFGPTGNPTPAVQSSCFLVPNIWCVIQTDGNKIPSGSLGSAYVDGGEDISVTALQLRSGGIDADSGYSSQGIGDQAFERAANTLYAPAVYQNYYGWSSSFFQVINTGASAANITFQFYGRAGYADHGPHTISNVPARGLATLHANQVVGGGEWAGSVVISASQGLVAKVTNSSGGHTTTYNAGAGGSTTAYVPAAYKANYDITTGLIVQNIGTGSSVVDLLFYPRAGGSPIFYSLGSIDALRSSGIHLSNIPGVPNDFAGSVTVVSQGNQPVVVISRGDRTGAGFYSHSGISVPTDRIQLPHASKSLNDRTTSYLIQNTSTTSSCNVTAYYFGAGGQEVVSVRKTFTLAANGAAGRWQGHDTTLPSGWTGGITLQAACSTIVAFMRDDLSVSVGAFNASAR